jgi:competence protein ComEC
VKVLDAPPPGWRIRRWTSGVRARLQDGLHRTLGAHAPVAEALVLAERGGIPFDERDRFAGAGVAHLLAISGFHVGVVAGLLVGLAAVLGLHVPTRFAVAAVGVAVYVAFLGFPPAALRAGLLLLVLALGRLFRRPVHRIGALSGAFLVMLVLRPGMILQPGFQLSFLGSLGLAVLSERPSSLRGVRRWLHDGVRAGTAATLFTFPAVVWHFGRISLVGIPTTLLLSPLVALAVPMIGGTLLLHLLVPGGAEIIAMPTRVVLAAIRSVVEAAGRLPFADARLARDIGPSLVLGLVFTLVLRRRLEARTRRGGLILGFGMAAALLVGLPAARIVESRDSVEIVVLDVGQGDAIAVRTPGDRWILVDAGPAGRGYDAGAARVVPFLKARGARRLEALVLSHPDLDHLGGMHSVLKEVPVAGVFGGARPEGRGPFVEALSLARRLGVPWVRMSRGDSLALDGMVIRALHPPDPGHGPSRQMLGPNDRSVVLLLSYGRFTALLTGDAPVSVEQGLLAAGLVGTGEPLSLLKVGHHGSSTSTSRDLLEATRPGVAVIPVGRGNRFGHPHPGVLGRLRRSGTEIWRTDLDGSVRIRGFPDGRTEVELLP